MDLEVRTRLVKLLNMFRSDYDGEIVASVKAIQVLVKKHKIDWDKALIKDRVDEINAKVINEAMAKAMEKGNQVAYDFFGSLFDQYLERGFLTEKQQSAFMKFYSRL